MGGSSGFFSEKGGGFLAKGDANLKHLEVARRNLGGGEGDKGSSQEMSLGGGQEAPKCRR